MGNKIKITVETLVSTIRNVSPRHFEAFHLTPCGQCGLPCFQQPCACCGYYPLDSDRSTHAKPGSDAEASAEKFARIVGGRDGSRSIFSWYASSKRGTCDPIYNAEIAIILNTHDDLYEWPTAAEVFDAFGKGSDREAVKTLNLVGLGERDPVAYWTFQKKLAIARKAYWQAKIDARDYYTATSYCRDSLQFSLSYVQQELRGEARAEALAEARLDLLAEKVKA